MCNESILRSDSPEYVADVQVKKDIVGSKFSLVGTVYLLDRQVVVHVLQRLHTLGQVFVVDLLVEVLHVQFAEACRAMNVKAGALFHQIDSA